MVLSVAELCRFSGRAHPPNAPRWNGEGRAKEGVEEGRGREILRAQWRELYI